MVTVLTYSLCGVLYGAMWPARCIAAGGSLLLDNINLSSPLLVRDILSEKHLPGQPKNRSSFAHPELQVKENRSFHPLPTDNR